MPDLIQYDPGQVLVPLDAPKTQSIQAAGEFSEARLERYRDTRPRGAFRLIDDARAITEHDEVGFARRQCHFERVEQREPFGVSARSFAQIFADVGRATENRGHLDRPRVGAAPSVEKDFGQCARDQASTKVPSLRTRRAECSSIIPHSPGFKPETVTSIGSS